MIGRNLRAEVGPAVLPGIPTLWRGRRGTALLDFALHLGPRHIALLTRRTERAGAPIRILPTPTGHQHYLDVRLRHAPASRFTDPLQALGDMDNGLDSPSWK